MDQLSPTASPVSPWYTSFKTIVPRVVEKFEVASWRTRVPLQDPVFFRLRLSFNVLRLTTYIISKFCKPFHRVTVHIFSCLSFHSILLFVNTHTHQKMKKTSQSNMNVYLTVSVKKKEQAKFTIKDLSTS